MENNALNLRVHYGGNFKGKWFCGIDQKKLDIWFNIAYFM